VAARPSWSSPPCSAGWERLADVAPGGLRRVRLPEATSSLPPLALPAASPPPPPPLPATPERRCPRLSEGIINGGIEAPRSCCAGAALLPDPDTSAASLSAAAPSMPAISVSTPPSLPSQFVPATVAAAAANLAADRLGRTGTRRARRSFRVCRCCSLCLETSLACAALALVSISA